LSFFRIYFYFIESKKTNPVDYIILQYYLYKIHRSLSKQTLFNSFSSFEDYQSSLKSITNKNTGDLLEVLGVAISIVGKLDKNTRFWTNNAAATVIEPLNKIITIFIVLLIQNKSSKKRRSYLIEIYYLPNRFWRNLRWYIRIADYSSRSLQRFVILYIYKFLETLLEIIPVYNRYWTAQLSEIVYCLINLDSEISISWRRAWIYWKNCTNTLKKLK